MPGLFVSTSENRVISSIALSTGTSSSISTGTKVLANPTAIDLLTFSGVSTIAMLVPGGKFPSSRLSTGAVVPSSPVE
jgi:hypothetical protein